MRNRVQLIGNLGSAPEVKEISGHGTVANVSIATHEIYKNDKGEYVTETTWHNLVLWGKLAENAGKLFKKGSEVAVDGKIINHSYEGKDGVKRYVSEILVNDFTMLGVKPGDKKDSANPTTLQESQDANPKRSRKAAARN
jgi:single-strand DNA-binding protein